MRAAAGLVVTVSGERIGEEIAKLFSARKPSIGIEILREAGVLAHLWPELLEGIEVDQNDWHAYDVYRHNLATLDAAPAGDLTLRLAALLHDVAKRAPPPRAPTDGAMPSTSTSTSVPIWSRRCWRGCGCRTRRWTTVAHLVRQHITRPTRRAGPHAAALHPADRAGQPRSSLRAALADIAGSGLPSATIRTNASRRASPRCWPTPGL